MIKDEFTEDEIKLFRNRNGEPRRNDNRACLHPMAHGAFMYNDKNNNLFAAGYNGQYQLGFGNSSTQYKYKSLKFFKDKKLTVMDAQMAYYFSIVLDSDGQVWTVGHDNYGQLGKFFIYLYLYFYIFIYLYIYIFIYLYIYIFM